MIDLFKLILGVLASLFKSRAKALYRRPRTTKPEPGHKIHPYLLRGIEITRPDQVWVVYLAVVLYWFSRGILSWHVSITWRRHSASRRSRMLWL